MIALVLFVLCTCSLAATEDSCGPGKRLIKSGGLTDSDKQAIIDAHNRLRQSVALGQVSSQPPAANMMELVWDDELAAGAQRWSDHCITDHDRVSERKVARFDVGQNLAATWTTRPPSEPADSEPDFLKQIDAWFDEVNVYGFKPIDNGHGTGHYSQLVWGESSHVGCGFTFYHDNVRGYTKLYVCNYGPGGNVFGSSPYEKGSPSCTAFGLTESSKYSGLCAASFTSSSSYQNSFVSNVIPDSTGDSKGFNYQFFNQYNNEFKYQYQGQKPQLHIDTAALAANALKAFKEQQHTFLPVDGSKSSHGLTIRPADFSETKSSDSAVASALKSLQDQLPSKFRQADSSPLKSLQQQLPSKFQPVVTSSFKSLSDQLPSGFLQVGSSSLKSLSDQLPSKFQPVVTSSFKSLSDQLPSGFLQVGSSSLKSLSDQLPSKFQPVVTSSLKSLPGGFQAVGTSSLKSLQQQLPSSFQPVGTSSLKSLQQQLPSGFLSVGGSSSKSLQLPGNFLPVDSSKLFKSDSSNLLGLLTSNLLSKQNKNTISIGGITFSQ